MTREKKRELVLFFIIMIIGAAFYYFSGMGCPILFFTGIPCPGCGMTRSLLCLLRFDIEEALQYHPLGIVMPFLAIGLLFGKIYSKKWFNRILQLFLALFLIVYIIRLLNPEDVIVKINVSGGKIYQMFQMIFY